MPVRVAAVLLLAAGCYGPTLDPCGIRCGVSPVCPAEMGCAPDGFCHGVRDDTLCTAVPPGDGPPPDDGSPPGDAGPGPDGPCMPSSTSTVFDDFSSGETGSLYASATTVTAVTGGELAIQLGELADANGGETWGAPIDAAGAVFLVEVTSYPTADTNAEAVFLLEHATSASGFKIHSGALEVWHDDTFASSTTVTGERWLRIALTSSATTYAVSSDGLGWTLTSNRPSLLPDWQTGTKIDLGARDATAETTSRKATFDNLNLLPCP